MVSSYPLSYRTASLPEKRNRFELPMANKKQSLLPLAKCFQFCLQFYAYRGQLPWARGLAPFYKNLSRVLLFIVADYV